MGVTGKRPRGAPKERWKDALRKDMEEVGVTEDDIQDRSQKLTFVGVLQMEASLGFATKVYFVLAGAKSSFSLAPYGAGKMTENEMKRCLREMTLKPSDILRRDVRQMRQFLEFEVALLRGPGSGDKA
ncbi:hypothetical protein ANCCEY_02574 [Ancylostoma ceylanicum]|uniref:Uncharacterized protein n=1 Tax=Ancylostoma ceylanicum TaxID=53326 RepID=A0A0D6M2L1_9BILA|nr:hypothetical protein ANCCEY_02574 [Ancylostoma ceylanicum]